MSTPVAGLGVKAAPLIQRTYEMLRTAPGGRVKAQDILETLSNGGQISKTFLKKNVLRPLRHQGNISITMDALPADAVKGASSDFSWTLTDKAKRNMKRRAAVQE